MSYLLLYLPKKLSENDEIKNLTDNSRNTGVKRLVPVIPRSEQGLFIDACHLVYLDAVL